MPIIDRSGRRLAYQMGRPRVSAHDGELRAERIRASIAAARERVRAGTCATACPAAQQLGVNGENGLTIRCGIERSLITERESPSSLANFCLAGTEAADGGYSACSTWRAERERLWEGRLTPLVSTSEGQ